MGKGICFLAVICLKYLLDENNFMDFYNELCHLIQTLSNSLKTIGINDNLVNMGFPIYSNNIDYDFKDIINI